MTQPTILIVEADQATAAPIVSALGTSAMPPVHCTLAPAALDGRRDTHVDLVVLDVGLPDLSGFEVCRRLRTFTDIPVIFLTARHDEIDRIVGLEIGADDYVVKPFSPRELAARVRVILRRFHRTAAPEPAPAPASADAPAPVASGFTLDTDGARVSWLGHALDLTRYEFGLMVLLVRHPGRIYSREQLIDLVWHEALDSADRTVDTHIKTLRAKLRAIDPERDPIRTHRGMGYSLQP